MNPDHVQSAVRSYTASDITDWFLSLLSDYKPHPKLLIVGGGPDQKNLQEAARTAGMSENILFAGMIAHEKIPDYYAAGDIFVSASESESQGLTYIEAMASGLPLLCKKDDCLCNVVENGKNGFTWDSREEFYSHLDRLISCVLEKGLS